MPTFTMIFGVLIISLVLRNSTTKVFAIISILFICATWQHLKDVGKEQEIKKLKLKENPNNWDKPKMKF